MTTFAARVAKANQQLRASKAKVTIFICGDRLWLRASLYPRPGTKRYRDNPNKKNQEAISTGCECNTIGLNSAICKARLFSLQVQTGEFDWADWVKSLVRKQKKTIAAWVELFEADYFTHRQRTYQSETTWDKDYKAAFLKLDGSRALEVGYLLQVARTAQEHTKTRRRLCRAYRLLLDRARLEGGVQLQAVAGNCSPLNNLAVEALHWDYKLYAYSVLGLQPISGQCR